MAFLSNKTIEHLRTVTNLPDLSNTKYTCISKIASGGMGTIYAAEDKELRRKIALKILDIPDPDGDMTDRMKQEAYIIAALEHPSIVPIHDVGTLPDGRIFYTMKYVKGQTLADKIEFSTLIELLRIFQKICEGVAFAHANHVIHRDLKPENIMVGDFGEVLVMDWGLAKVLDPIKKSKTLVQKTRPQNMRKGADAVTVNRLADKPRQFTEHGTIMGTPAYMSPEQERGEIDQIDQRTDIYSLGAIFKEIIDSKYTRKAAKHKPEKLKFSYRAFADLLYRPPKRLYAISDKAMQDVKSARYSDAMELFKDVENYLNGEPVSAYKENIIEKVARWLSQNKFLILLIGVYIIAKLLITFLGGL